jgi:glucose-6-phosphate dehydrogenase assembly protein OpcA
MPAELIEWVAKFGAMAAPILLFLWWDERTDRKTLQQKLDTLSERTITAMVEFKNLLQTVVDVFNGKRT